jgi:hypothetical protein
VTKARIEEAIFRRLLQESHVNDVTLKPSIEVVKYRDMPSKVWYESPRHRGWYYHTPRGNEVAPAVDAAVLEPTLDPCLRELAMCLNRMGHSTLPSCSGHYLDADQCDGIYEDLMQDCIDIRGSGLPLRDVETGATLRLKDPNWALPWSRLGFREALVGAESRPEGYIAFITSSPHADIVRLLQRLCSRLPGTKMNLLKKDDATQCELRVYTGDEATQCATWRMLGAAVKTYKQSLNGV